MPLLGIRELNANQTGYEKLLNEDSSPLEERRRQPAWLAKLCQGRYINYIAAGIGLLSGILLIAFFSWAFWHYRNTTTASIDWVPCGNSSLEARAAGCHYEPMQRSWIPHACYFEKPSEDYDPFSDRKWFFDANLTQQITGDDIRKLREGDDLDAYTHFFHNEHCVYCWRKLAIAVEKRLPMIDSKTADYHHSTHCAMLLMEELYDVGMDKFNTRFETFSPLMFQTCVPLTWK
jgi:hypothetical protein